MSKILSMHHYLQNKRFNEEIIPFLQSTYSDYTVYRDKNQLLITIEKKSYLFIFLQFIPLNQHTVLPSLVDRFNEIRYNSRQSSGEWVVDTVFSIEPFRYEELIQTISNTSSLEQSLVILRNKIKKEKQDI